MRGDGIQFEPKRAEESHDRHVSTATEREGGNEYAADEFSSFLLSSSFSSLSQIKIQTFNIDVTLVRMRNDGIDKIYRGAKDTQIMYTKMAVRVMRR